MANSSMNIRMDKEIKQQAQQIFSALGMDMTTAINVFLRQAIRCNGFPFELRLDFVNAETHEVMELSQKLIDKNKEAYEVLSK